MRLLIDTCNVLHRTGILPPELAGVDEAGLVDLVQNSRYRNLRIDFMCDGPQIAHDGSSRGSSGGRCRFFFAGRDRSADCLIVEAIGKSSSPRRLLVVSSDRAIQAAARKRRSRIICADDFLSQLTHDVRSGGGQGTRKPGGSPELQRSTQEWLVEFGLHETIREHDAEAEPGRPVTGSGKDLDTADRDRPETSSEDPEPTGEDERWGWLMREADRLWKMHEGG